MGVGGGAARRGRELARAARSGTIDARLDHANGNRHCLDIERPLRAGEPVWWSAYAAAYWAELARLEGRTPPAA